MPTAAMATRMAPATPNKSGRLNRGRCNVRLTAPCPNVAPLAHQPDDQHYAAK